MNGRFRIRPEYLDEVTSLFSEIGVEPLRIYDHEEGSKAVEIGNLTDEQGRLLATRFQHHWSAIVGIVGGTPFETKH